MNVDFKNNIFMWEILPINVFNDILWLSLIFIFTYQNKSHQYLTSELLIICVRNFLYDIKLFTTS